MTLYDSIFDELNECTYQGFIDGCNRDRAMRDIERRCEKLEAELEIVRAMYKKCETKYLKLRDRVAELGVKL